MINIAHLLGRVGNKTTKELPNGTTICTLSLVTSRRFVDTSGAKREKDTWHKVSLFNKLAEIAIKYANVGDIVFIIGEIQNEEFTDKNNEKRWAYSVTAKEIKLLPNPKREGRSESEGNTVLDDTLPF